MDISIEQFEAAPEITRIRITGRIDSYTVERVDEELNSLIHIGSNKLVCDLSGVEFVAGPGLKAFLRTIQTARKQDGDLKLCGLRPEVAKMFSLAGFTSIATLYTSEAQALQAFGVAGATPAYEQTLIAGGAAFDKTMIAPGKGDPAYEQTMIPGAPARDMGFDKTLVPGALDGADIGFEKTMIPGAAGGAEIGFEQTMLDAPAKGRGNIPDALRKKFAQITQPGVSKEDTCAALRKKLEAAAQKAPPAAAEKTMIVDEDTCKTIMNQIDQIETKEPASASGGQQDAAPGDLTESRTLACGTVKSPLVQPVTLVLPAKEKFLSNVSEVLGTLGTLAGVKTKTINMVKYGMAVVEVCRAGMGTVDSGCGIGVTIRIEKKVVSTEIFVPGKTFDLYSVLRPQVEKGVTSDTAAKSWLAKLAKKVTISSGEQGVTVTLTNG